jgi:predicted RNase H-like HicB family nuclease
MSKYLYILEKTTSGFSAYVPDLPGCVAAGESLAEVTDLSRDAIEFHLDGMREEGYQIPEPATTADYAEIKSA